MTKLLHLSLCLLLSSIIYAQTSVNIGKVRHLAISTAVEATLVQSDANKVEYTVIKGDADDVVIKQTGDKLVVKVENSSWFWGSDTKIRATIYSPNISEISCSAGSELTSDGVYSVDEMSISTSSGSRTDLYIDANHIDVDCSSGSSSTVRGETHSLAVNTSSGSSAKLQSLKAKKVDADASSGSSIKVHVTEALTAEASSGASVKYEGNPETKNTEASSGGSVRSM